MSTELDAEEYEKQVLQDFASDGSPDLLIVVDKLLTGFDEPRNTVLYIDKPLKGHNLIQAWPASIACTMPSVTGCWWTTAAS